ncbi:MAG: glycosyltransferase family 9 protein [Candidatus Methylomirabilia bacterium]
MKRAVIVRFSSLGDVVLTLPVASSLKAAFPAAEILYLTKAAYRPLLEGQPGVDRVVTLEEAGPGLKGLRRLCRGLGRFDLALDLHRTLRSRSCLGALNADHRFSYRKDALLRRLWAAGWMRGRMEGAQPHVIDRYLQPLRRFGVTPAVTVPELLVSAGRLSAVREVVVAAGVRDPGRVAVVVPGARWPNKRWSPSSFAAVADGLRQTEGLEPVIAGDASDQEAAEAVRALIPGGAPLLAGRTSLPELAALLKIARVVVANDSGPAHLAAAVGAPVVVLFGPTHEAFGFVPRGERVRVISRALACRPCTVHGGLRCPNKRRACLDEIAPQEVLSGARELLVDKTDHDRRQRN